MGPVTPTSILFRQLTYIILKQQSAPSTTMDPGKSLEPNMKGTGTSVHMPPAFSM